MAGTLDQHALGLFKTAAESAAMHLPRLRKQQALLAQKVESLENVIRAWETLSGNPMPFKDLPDEPVRKRRGQVREHVDAAVPTSDGLSERDLRLEIEKQTGVSYSRAAVYSVLARGKTAGRYVSNAGKWSRAAAQEP